MIRATEFLLKNRILPEAPAIDGNIVGDGNTLRTCRAKCSNVTWDILEGYGGASKWSHGSELSPNRLTSAEIWPKSSTQEMSILCLDSLQVVSRKEQGLACLHYSIKE